MRLNGLRQGDLVQVAGSLGHVESVQRGRVLVRWIGRSQIRWITARQVENIWTLKRKRERGGAR
jgi:hypothetical protein